MCKLICPNLSSSCIIITLLCIIQVNFIVNAATTSTCSSSSNCTLREWLVKIKEESYSLECTLSQLEKSTALLSKVNYPTTSTRLNQITKLKKTISNLKGEIEIINLTCSTFYGPDCNLTTPECNSKCITCSSPGVCSNCSGNWDGPTCSVCKTGWNGTDCNTPICDSKCTNCTSPGVCSNCTGNWNGTTCQVCKSGWNGTDCNTPICNSNCATCSAPNVCPTCKTGWYGSDCNSTTPPLILTTAQITKFTTLIMPTAQITSSKLLFKATRDGFLASAFHSKCDNKGPTIVIVKTPTGAIFGGYISVNWQSTFGGIYVADSSAFMFSLIASGGAERYTKLTRENGYHYKTFANYEYSLFNHPNYGPTFGGGGGSHDLNIQDYANTNINSYSTQFCYSFCETTMTRNTVAAQTYLAGSNPFQVEDYEVYSL